MRVRSVGSSIPKNTVILPNGAAKIFSAKRTLTKKSPNNVGAFSNLETKARNSRLKTLIGELGETWDIEAPQSSTARSLIQQGPSSSDDSTSLNHSAVQEPHELFNISPILARDACKCPLCVDPSDKQRNFSYAEIPPDVGYEKIAPAKTKGQSIVSWRGDAPPHTPGTSTVFDHDTIASLKHAFRNKRWQLYNMPQHLWDAETFNLETNRIDFNEYLNDDDALAAALKLLWRDGLVFVDGVPESETSVTQTVNRIGPLMNTFYGPTWDVKSVPNAKNVAYTAKYLGFHMDLLYMREPPAFQFLHCIHNESSGGESRFADTFKAVDKLYAQDPAKFRSLNEYDIRYEYDNDGHFYSDEKPTILGRRMLNIPKRPTHNARFPLVMSEVGRVHWSPPFVGNLASKEHNALVSLVTASKAFSDILEQPEMVVQEKMDSGTCVIFDNLRVVHARNAFNLNSGRRWLKGAYLARQDFESKASALLDRMPAGIRVRSTHGESRVVQ